MGYLKNKQVLVGKAEGAPGAPGTLESLTSTDFDCRVYEIARSNNIESTDLKYATGDHTTGDNITGRQSGELSFNVKANDGGAAGTAPNHSKFLLGCGLKETVYAGVGVGYTPAAEEDLSTMTLWDCEIERAASPKAKAYLYAGCFGNAVFKADNIGAPLQYDFTFMGKYNSVADIADASTIATLTGADTDVPQAYLNSTVTVGGVSMCASAFSFDFGNDVQGEPCQNGTSGYNLFSRVAANPVLTMTVLNQSVATFDEMTKLIDEETVVVSIATGATIPITLSVPKGQIISVTPSDVDGMNSFEMQIKAKRNTGGADVEAVYELLYGAKA